MLRIVPQTITDSQSQIPISLPRRLLCFRCVITFSYYVCMSSIFLATLFYMPNCGRPTLLPTLLLSAGSFLYFLSFLGQIYSMQIRFYYPYHICLVVLLANCLLAIQFQRCSLPHLHIYCDSAKLLPLISLIPVPSPV